MPHQYRATQVLEVVDNGGWSAVRFASEMLSYKAAEGSITKDQETDYLVQVRAVIDAVTSDETLSPSDRSRIVDLLQKVERALVAAGVSAEPVGNAVDLDEADAGQVVRDLIATGTPVPGTSKAGTASPTVW